MSTYFDGHGLKAVCIRQGYWRIDNYEATHVPHPSRLTSAWVIWHASKPVAVVETMPQVREWITTTKAGDAQ